MAEREDAEKQSRKAIDETSVYIQDTLLSVSAKIGSSLKDAVNEAFDGVEASVLKTVSNDLSRAFKSSAKFSDDVASNQEKINRGLISSKDVTKQLETLALKRSALARKIMLARRLGAEINLEDLSNSKKALDIQNEQLIKDKERTESIEKNMGATGEIFKRLSKNKFFGSILNAEEGLKKMRSESAKGTKGFKLMGKGIKAAFKGIEKASIILFAINSVVKVLRFVLSLFVAAQERTVAIAKQLSISRDAAEGIRQRFVEIAADSDNILLNSKALVQANQELVNSSGLNLRFNKDLLENQVFLTKNLGVSGDNASRLNLLLGATGANTEEVNNNVKKITDEFALANGVAVPFNSIIKEVAGSSAEIQGYFGFSTEALTKGVLQVRKFGLNLEKATSVAKGLLNFEESIGSELEAELFTGKQFNFERARMLALTGDVAGATEDVMKQMQGLTEEQRKSPLIMESLAKASGLSVSELNEAFIIQKNFNGQTEKYNELLKRGGKIGRENAVKQLALEGATMKEIKKTLTVQESFAAALEKAKDQFTGLVDSGALDILVDAIIKFTNFLGKILGTALSKEEKDTIGKLQEKGKTEQEARDLVKATRGPSAMDFAGMAISPAFGLARGLAKTTKKAINKRQAQGQIDEILLDDFTIRSNPKDSLVMAGGTRFGEETNKLLKELISAVKEGGDVFIDGNKAGMALSLGSYRSSTA